MSYSVLIGLVLIIVILYCLLYDYRGDSDDNQK